MVAERGGVGGGASGGQIVTYPVRNPQVEGGASAVAGEWVQLGNHPALQGNHREGIKGVSLGNYS